MILCTCSVDNSEPALVCLPYKTVTKWWMSEGRGDWIKGEEISQRTYHTAQGHRPQCGEGGRELDEGGEREKNREHL